jgi:hypothetical protein
VILVLRGKWNLYTAKEELLQQETGGVDRAWRNGNSLKKVGARKWRS